MKDEENGPRKKLLREDGYWGVYQEEDNAPEERWDPFQTLTDKYGTKIGHCTYISKLRANRPIEYSEIPLKLVRSNLNDEKDSFCQIVEGKLPAIVLTKDLSQKRDPFVLDAKFENLAQTNAFTIINLFPPMARYVQNNHFLRTEKKKSKPPKGISLVHVLTKHYVSIETVPLDELILYFNNIILSLEICQKSLRSQGINNIGLMQFFNIGPASGASILHLHGQSMLFIDKKGHGWKNQGFLVVYEEHKSLYQNRNYCLGCEYAKKVTIDPLNQEINLKERIFWEDDFWLCLVAYAPENDGQLRLMPKRHLSTLLELNSNEIASLSKALLASNYALTQFINNYGKKLHLSLDRNIIFRQQHFGYTSKPHLLIDILPVQRVGGGEKLDNFKLSHIFPEEIACSLTQYLQEFII
ncbi:MAG: hypothetical protein EAX86_05940 [Candidatus Heimdallarchaeota archaeon]|nr:hypothetical protein [Candidatus Heimdallarchaeota archaeon]